MFRRFRSDDQKNEIEVNTDENSVCVYLPEANTTVLYNSNGVVVRDSKTDEVLFLRKRLKV